MNDARQDLIHIQELVGTAFSATGSLVALTDGGQMNPNKLQKTLEQTRSSATAGFTLCSIRSCRTAGIRHRAG